MTYNQGFFLCIKIKFVYDNLFQPTVQWTTSCKPIPIPQGLIFATFGTWFIGNLFEKEHERLVGLVKPSCFIIHPQIFIKNANHLPKVAPIFTKYFLQIQKNIHDYKNLNSSEEIVRPHLNSRCSGFINEICLQMFKFTSAICKFVSYMFYFCVYSLPGNKNGIFVFLVL